MMARWLALVFLCFTAFAAPRAAHAEDPAMRSAKRHYDRGEKLFALGKFDEALDEYQKAFDAKPLPGFLFNIGQCYRNLGDYDQAIFSFKKYLKLDPSAPNKDKVDKLIEELEDKKERGEGQKLIQKPDKDKDKDKVKGPEDGEEPVRPPPHKSITSKWWFWTGLGIVAVGAGVGTYELTKSGAPSTDLGNITFGK
jgi:tetratricopeptide (TPR) repeat protein